jgi:hypothetical protein
MNWSYIVFGSLGRKNAAPVKSMGAVSPMILARARMVPVAMPGSAFGRTLCRMDSHLLVSLEPILKPLRRLLW